MPLEEEPTNRESFTVLDVRGITHHQSNLDNRAPACTVEHHISRARQAEFASADLTLSIESETPKPVRKSTSNYDVSQEAQSANDSDGNDVHRTNTS
jgi:hypothetical protein